MRTCARYHVEVRKTKERKKMEEELRLRSIASVIAREVDYFWSNIEQVQKKNTFRFFPTVSHDPSLFSKCCPVSLLSQVAEIKLHLEILGKRRKVLRLQKSQARGASGVCLFPVNTCYVSRC